MIFVLCCIFLIGKALNKLVKLKNIEKEFLLFEFSYNKYFCLFAMVMLLVFVRFKHELDLEF